MRPIEYFAPSSVAEAVSLLAEKAEQARPLAGGTDLIVQLNGGRQRAERLVDVKAVPDANVLAFDPAQGLLLGAAVPCYRIYGSPFVAEHYPAVVDAASIIGGIQIQGRATFGGNLCNAAPSADGVPPLIVLGATCVVAGPNGTRRMPVERFCTGPGRMMLEPGEFLVCFEVPPPQRNSGARYLRFTPRNEMDIAVAGVGAWVLLDGSRSRFVAARIALAAVAPTPLMVEEAGRALEGREVSDAAVEKAARLAREAARPITDMRGTIEQRKHLVYVLTKRALWGAVERAKEWPADG